MKYSEFFHTIQGEGKLVGVPSVFFRTSYCNLRCVWCSAIGTRVLRSDLRWAPIENLNPGDWVVGALRQDKGGHLQLQPTQVIETAARRAPVVRFLTEDGIQFACSADHLLYQVTTRTQDSSKIHVGWRKAGKLGAGNAVRCILPPEEPQLDVKAYERGWLCGMAEGDGCFWSLRKGNKSYRRFRLALSDFSLLEQFHQFTKRAGYRLHFAPHQHSGFKGYSVMEALWLTESQRAESFERWLKAHPQNQSYYRGWLAGFFDAEGSYSGIIRFAQKEGIFKQKAIDFAAKLGFRPTSESRGVRLGGTTPEILRFYSLCQPKSLNKWNFWGISSQAHQHITNIEHATAEEVISLKTTSGTYVSEGILSHNCDTPFTSWNPENKDITLTEAVEAISKYDCKHVVITGGEPFIQVKELTELCQELDQRGHHITIETNATIFAPVAAHLISMSPKLRNSNPPSENRYFQRHERGRIRTDVIRQFLNRYECQVKFVVDQPADIEEIQALQAEIAIPAETIVLMPQGITPKELAPKQEWLVDICKDHGYRYSPRVHVDIWGDKRGV